MSVRESTPAPHIASAHGASGAVRPDRRAIRKPRRDALTRVRHDLRSLTHAVRGYADLLASESHGPLNGPQQGFVAHVRGAALELERLVEMCVELSRADGRCPSERTSSELGPVLTQIQRRLAAHEFACEVRSAASPSLPLETDGELLAAALLELAAVVTGDCAKTCLLGARETEGKLWLELHGSVRSPVDANETADGLENELSNREFVRLKFAESLLRRAGFRLFVDRELTGARCELLNTPL